VGHSLHLNATRAEMPTTPAPWDNGDQVHGARCEPFSVGVAVNKCRYYSACVRVEHSIYNNPPTLALLKRESPIELSSQSSIDGAMW
jgi:hypothetical protein